MSNNLILSLILQLGIPLWCRTVLTNEDPLPQTASSKMTMQTRAEPYAALYVLWYAGSYLDI